MHVFIQLYSLRFMHNTLSSILDLSVCVSLLNCIQLNETLLNVFTTGNIVLVLIITLLTRTCFKCTNLTSAGDGLYVQT